MVCRRCGFRIHEDVNYCPSCGYPMREKAVYTVPHTGNVRPVVNTEKAPHKKKKRVWLWFVVVFLGLMILGTVLETQDTPEPEVVAVETPEPTVEVAEEEPPLAFLDDFTEYGYSAEQIEEMKTILLNVGITEITDLEIGNVSYGMQVVKGVALKGESLVGPRDEIRIQFNIENGVLFYIHIYCPFDYLSGTDEGRAELYYDYEGGYLKKIDWENKTVIDY